MEASSFRIWVGVDRGDREHQVCAVVDGREQQRKIEHSGAGMKQLVTWLLELSGGRPEIVGVGIEVPHGVVVDCLLEHRFSVFSINPKQLDRFRDRFTVAGAKDDSRDARVLASSLETDPQAFRHLAPEDPLVVQLREATHVLEDLKEERRALANRLRDQLNRYYPQILELSKAADEAWIWDLIEHWPLPEQARRARAGPVKHILREHHIRRVTTDDVLKALRAPALPVAPGVCEAATGHIELLLPRLRLVFKQQAHCESTIATLLRRLGEDSESAPEEKREHRDVDILRSMPGAGEFVTATMLAEASRPLTERNYHVLRARSGTAPVTRQSGKTRFVGMRYACNPRLRNALHYMSNTARLRDPRAEAVYRSHRSKGQTHARALRAVGDRQLQLLVTLLERDELFDFTRRQASP